MNFLIHEIIDATYWRNKNKSKMGNWCTSCICLQRRKKRWIDAFVLINFVSWWTFYVLWWLSFHFFFLLRFSMMIQFILYASVIICWIEMFTVYDIINRTVCHLIMFQFNSQSTSASSQAGLGLGVQASGLNNVTSATLQQQNNSIHQQSNQQALMSSGPKDAGTLHFPHLSFVCFCFILLRWVAPCWFFILREKSKVGP